MKLIVTLLMILYLYALSFGIFLTDMFRIPAPIIFCFPLIFIFKNKEETPFLYFKEVLLISLAIFLYYVVGLSEFKTFAKNMLSVMLCALFFNYYIGTSRSRFNSSIYVFYSLLTISAVLMVVDSFYEIEAFRGLLMDEKVMQSPAGIAIYQFSFGYQLAALTPFLFIYTCTFKKSLLTNLIVLFVCLVFLLLGMQRSAFLTFIIATTLFLIIYYRFKAVFFISISLIFCGLIYYFVLNDYLDGMNNIISKNEQSDPSHNRTNLTAENLNIYFNHPYGLIFYGKNWGDAIYRNYTFSDGITSHNAYLMFITYLGPILGLGLLVAIYHKICGIFINILQMIRAQENRLLVCLCFSFLAVSLNAFFHNAWLIEANGSTVFLFFSILHMYKFKMVDLVAGDQPLKTLKYA
jgi:hypothetical protein